MGCTVCSGYFLSPSVWAAEKQLRQMFTRGDFGYLGTPPVMAYSGDVSSLPAAKRDKELRFRESCCNGNDGFYCCFGLDHVELGTVVTRSGVELCTRMKEFVRGLCARRGWSPGRGPDAVLIQPDSGTVLQTGDLNVLRSVARSYVAGSDDCADACFAVVTTDLKISEIVCWDIRHQKTTKKVASTGHLVMPVYKYYYYFVV